MVLVNSRMSGWFAMTVMIGLSVTAPGKAVADAQSNKSCEIHAIAMVAEMKAGAAQPMSDQEVSLVRATAIKSCLAQAGSGANTVETTLPAAAKLSQSTVVTPQAKTDTSFFGTLGAIFAGPKTRKAGNERLLERSGH